MTTDPAYQKVTIERIIEEAPEVKTFVLRPERGVQYKAGQFLTFVFDDLQGEERRSYSFSSSPEVDNHLSITIKRVTNGKYSRPLIDNAQEGVELVTSGVSGLFTIPPDIDKYRQVFFFAAGIGITPVYSLIKSLLSTHPSIEVILIYSNSSIADTVFYQELLELHHRYPEQLRLEFLISSSVNLSRARLSKWLLPQLVNIYGKAERHEQLFYTCGPFAYMRMVTIALEEMRYSKDQVKKEIFDTTRPVFKLTPPDTDEHQVTIIAGGEAKSFSVRYPTTIVRAAKENGIALPYSCEAGKCGSCIMQCTEGRAWMSYNEVLTEKEVAEGKILSCVAYPIAGDLVLTDANS